MKLEILSTIIGLSFLLTSCGGEKHIFAGKMTFQKYLSDDAVERDVEVMIKKYSKEKARIWVKGKGDWEIEKCLDGVSAEYRDMNGRQFWIGRYCSLRNEKSERVTKSVHTYLEKIDGDKLEFSLDFADQLNAPAKDVYKFSGAKK